MNDATIAALETYPVAVTRDSIRGRPVEQVIRDAASALRDEADPASLPALIFALEARYDDRTARRAAKASVE